MLDVPYFGYHPEGWCNILPPVPIKEEETAYAIQRWRWIMRTIPFPLFHHSTPLNIMPMEGIHPHNLPNPPTYHQSV